MPAVNICSNYKLNINKHLNNQHSQLHCHTSSLLEICARLVYYYSCIKEEPHECSRFDYIVSLPYRIMGYVFSDQSFRTGVHQSILVVLIANYIF